MGRSWCMSWQALLPDGGWLAEDAASKTESLDCDKVGEPGQNASACMACFLLNINSHKSCL